MAVFSDEYSDFFIRHSLPLPATLELNEFSAREIQDNAILMLTYAGLLETCGWKVTHLLSPIMFSMKLKIKNRHRYILWVLCFEDK